MKPDEEFDQFIVYEYFRKRFGWPPSVVDEQDAKVIEMMLVIDEHTEEMKKGKSLA